MTVTCVTGADGEHDLWIDITLTCQMNVICIFEINHCFRSDTILKIILDAVTHLAVAQLVLPPKKIYQRFSYKFYVTYQKKVVQHRNDTAALQL